MGTLFDVAAISAIALGAAYLGAVLHYYPQDVRISNGPRTVSFPEFRRHVFSGNDPFSLISGCEGSDNS